MNNYSQNYRKKEIQRRSNILLSSILEQVSLVFPDIFCRIKNEETQDDVGIDFQIELDLRITGQNIILFKLQHKGKEKQLTIMITIRKQKKKIQNKLSSYFSYVLSHLLPWPGSFLIH